MRLARLEARAELRLFDEAESELVARALIALSLINPSDAAVLSRLMSQLADINNMAQSAPSLRMRTSLGGQERDERSLSEHLCNLDGLEGDLCLPTKASL